MLVLVVHLALVAALFALGRWGRGHAQDLVSPLLPRRDRLRRVAAMRRGASVCYVAAAGLAVLSLSGLIV